MLHQKLHRLAPSVLGSDDEGCLALLVPLILFIEVLGHHVRVFECCGVHGHCPASGVLLLYHEKLCNIPVTNSNCVDEGSATIIILQPLLVLNEGSERLKISLLRCYYQSGTAMRVSKTIFMPNHHLNSFCRRVSCSIHQACVAFTVSLMWGQKGNNLCILLFCGHHQSSPAVPIPLPMLVGGNNLGYLRMVVVYGVHERSPAALVPEAILLPNKQFDGINMPLLARVHEGRHPLCVTLTNTESFFKQHPDGLHAVRMRSTHQPGQQKEAGLRASRVHPVTELCKPILQCLNHD
eukprot:XP_001709945.1 Hypothetical protein GL50803_115770 [Giardia lamblia ATCC 50803]